MIHTLRRYLRPEQVRELSLLLIILVTIFIFGTQIDSFYSFRTFNRISSSVMIITIVAIGQTLVVLTRNIDLSVGSIVGLTAYIIGQVVSTNNELSPVVVVLMSIGLGGLLGLVNGVLVAYGKVPAIIVTLGTLAIYRGILVGVANAQTILVSNLPDWLVDLPRISLVTVGEIEIRLLVAMAVAVVVIFQLLVTYLPYGRRLYAIGSNPEAASVAGLPARRIVLIAFVICGALAGLGGFFFLARFGTITVQAAQGLELQVVAAVVVGGVNIFGGSGTMIGALLGAVLIGTLEQSLIRMRINEFWKDAALGVLILLAVASDALILNRLRDLWARSALSSRTTDGPITTGPQKDSRHVT